VQAAFPSWLDPGRNTWGLDPGVYEPSAFENTIRDIGWLYGDDRYFRLQVDGWEHLPPAPALLVANHSGGTSVPDVVGFMVAWGRRFGVSRPCRPLGHDLIFAVERIGRAAARAGGLRARPALARAALVDLGHDALICPGGDIDTWRPHRDRYRVCFAGRKGYARLALTTGIPVTPVANAGAHDSFWVIARGRRLARVLQLPRIARAEIFPLHVSVPWGLALGPLPHVPLPVRLRYRFGPPVPLPRGWTPRDPSPDEVSAYDLRVQAAVQALLDQLAADEEPLRARIARRVRGDRR
jgi:1-acyl-sn-glycerol-3-phosphate acyltransferase